VIAVLKGVQLEYLEIAWMSRVEYNLPSRGRIFAVLKDKRLEHLRRQYAL